MTFFEWITSDTGPGRAALREYVKGREDQFQDMSSENDALVRLQQDPDLDTQRRADLEAAMSEAWILYRHAAGGTEDGADGQKKWRAWFFENLPIMMMGLVVILAILVLAAVLYPRGSLLQNLGRLEIARGLITFVFTFGVIFVTLILLIALFGSEKPDVLQKFERAKELFTAMIAVLGTILGFYFGEASVEQARSRLELAGPDAVLLAMAQLGLPIEGLTLTEDQVQEANVALGSEMSAASKRAALAVILEPPAPEGGTPGAAPATPSDPGGTDPEQEQQ